MAPRLAWGGFLTLISLTPGLRAQDSKPAWSLDWSASRRLVHFDHVEPSKADVFEGARKRWLAVLGATEADPPDGRPVFWSGDGVYLTFYPFESWSDLDVRRSTMKSAMEIAGKAATDDYDSGDAALVAPHHSEVWSRDSEMDYVPSGGALDETIAGAGIFELRRMPVGAASEGADDAWTRILDRLRERGAACTVRVFDSSVGRGQAILAWLVAGDDPAEAQRCCDGRTRRAIERLMPLQERLVLRRRPDLSRMEPGRSTDEERFFADPKKWKCTTETEED